MDAYILGLNDFVKDKDNMTVSVDKEIKVTVGSNPTSPSIEGNLYFTWSKRQLSYFAEDDCKIRA